MFYKKPLFPEIFLLALVIAIFHIAALKFSLYWITDWFDVLMHFLGGVLIGLFALFFFYSSGLIALPKDNLFLMIVIAVWFTLVIGLAWELWEIFVGFTDVFTDLGDTILDVVMDTLGAFTSVWYLKQKSWQEN